MVCLAADDPHRLAGELAQRAGVELATVARTEPPIGRSLIVAKTRSDAQTTAGLPASPALSGLYCGVHKP